MTEFAAHPASRPLSGAIRVPGDKSISHRALLIAAAAHGMSSIRGLSTGEDVLHTLRAIQLFGAGVTGSPDSDLRVEGGKLHEPVSVVDVGNSGTGIRLLAGWAAGLDGLTVLQGDRSVAQRPMDRVVTPLRQMGAVVDGRHGGRFPPLVVRGGGLQGIDYELPVASAQVKGAVLFAGLSAEGETTVRERTPTRAHTEEMLAACGADISIEPGAVTVRRSSLVASSLEVPGDPSQGAFWVVAACITPGSELTIENLYTGPGRAGFIDALLRMDADIEVLDTDRSRPVSTIRARHSWLKATEVSGAEVASLIDEIPVLAVAAAYAEGNTVFRDAAELKVKESDRIATMVSALNAVGADASPLDDGLTVKGSGGRPLRGGSVDSAGDHRVAMSLAVAALGAAGSITITGWESVATSYPSFEEDYHRCAS